MNCPKPESRQDDSGSEALRHVGRAVPAAKSDETKEKASDREDKTGERKAAAAEKAKAPAVEKARPQRNRSQAGSRPEGEHQFGDEGAA